MSKWINNDLFNKYVETKEQEQENTNRTFIRRSETVWATPNAGSQTQAEVYEGRFLPDPNNVFTDKYYYHMWKSGDKWNYVFCSKTWDFGSYCPVCALTSKLYMGTAKDKSIASQMKRRIRHAANWYVISDKRDLKIAETEKKAEGKVKIYEFPDKVDAKLKLQLLDKNDGLGSLIFDPGEEGHNFILRIKSTKPDPSGKTWPDYADSDFARKSSAIGTDKEIKTIMESRFSLKEYIKSLETTNEQIREILEKEMLYDLIKDEWAKNAPEMKVKKTAQDVSEEVSEEKEEKEIEQKKEDKNKKKEEDVKDFDDEDAELLKELEAMK